jgi:hypothetical protein
VTAEDLARQFHEAYERLAPSFGYETRPDSAVPWEKVPEKNRRLMTAVCGEVMATALAARSDARDRELYEQGEELSAARRALLTESAALAAANARADAAVRERDMFQLCVQNEKENAAKERNGLDAEWRAVVKADRESLAAARRDLRETDTLFLGTLAGIVMAIPGDPERIDDWLRTRIGIAREQFDKLRKARAALATPADGEDRDPVIEEVPPHLCGGNNCEECGGPGAHHTDTCSCFEEKRNV